jgi:hypothetical protein
MILRRRFLMGLGAVGSILLASENGRATTVRAVSLEELVRASRHVLLGVPVESYSRWERFGEARRIVTYSRVLTHADLDGSTPGAELLVRTLGGRVGDIAQLVHGEARLRQGSLHALFLHPLRDDALGVTAMAQGEFPVVVDARGVERLRPSPHLDHVKLLPRSAVARLDGKDPNAVAALVREAKRQ